MWQLQQIKFKYSFLNSVPQHIKKKILKEKIAYKHYPPRFCLCHQGIYEWNHHLFSRIINKWNLIMKTLIFFPPKALSLTISLSSTLNFFPCIVFMPYKLPRIHSQGNHDNLDFYFLLNITGLILFTFKYFFNYVIKIIVNYKNICG